MKKSILALSVLTVILAGCDGNSDKTEPKADQQPSAAVEQNASPAASGDISPNVNEPTSSAPTAVDPLQKKTSDLDWQGSYQGSLPGADGKNVDTTITLNEDQTFTMTQQIDGKDKKTEGKFAWSPEGTTLSLDNGKGKPEQYAIEDGTLIKLDAAGNKVSGDMAAQYELHKK
ncbi:copper resistance protein NlpE [Vibrio nitrifigilis]|uniref:Copper resistance protein NlpE N-terminal domain-containing protein n=1 Tax=Vibrio nitrifigilis TaxID=2789781 RepID=A0ABS0GB54_9VIBR|nr:copper resistance protein NlpE [Vibrio nitrifigilis]MBF8999655.1 copper resistance protein NlpE N-terminal domain-containing protein [Vibrio nitrifigilis]